MTAWLHRPPAPGRPHGRDDRGYALVLALFVLVITLTVGSAIALALQFRMERLRRETATVHLGALLDGALSHAVAELDEQPAWRGTGGERPLGEGVYAVRTEPVGIDRIRIHLTAVWGREGRAAEADYDRIRRRIVAWRPMTFDPHDPLGLDD